jgi:hypothetical protein
MDGDGVGEACDARVETALAFDGMDDFVSMPTLSGFQFGTGEFTIEVWFQAWGQGALVELDGSGTQGWRHLEFGVEHHGRGLSVYAYDANAYIYFETTQTVCDGRWHHGVLKRQGKSMYLYIDGGEAAVQTSDEIGLMQMDFSYGYVGYNYWGVIDDLRVWSTARTQTQLIRDMYRLPTITTGLMGYMPMDGGCRQQQIRDLVQHSDGYLGADGQAADTADPVWVVSDSPVLAPPDSDSDGWFDVLDNCPGTPNIGQEDGDGDGVGDACDNCPQLANSDQKDNEHDGIGDVCDPDDDNDGIADVADNCPMAGNSLQEDEDGDHVGDACDACPQTNPGILVDAAGCAFRRTGDFDRDGDVDQSDFGHFQICISGSVLYQTDPACADTLLDGDKDVDLADLAIFLNCMNGTWQLPKPGCP